MASFPASLVALLVACCAATAAATTFNVGDEYGWDLYYPAWTIGKTFDVGDSLVLKYRREQHTVTEVNESGFIACSGRHGRCLSYHENGVTTVTLTVRYFICDYLCSAGLKLAVNATIAGGDVGSTTPKTIPAGDAGGSLAPAGNAGGSLVPATSAVAATAVGALIKLALF